MAHEDDEDTLMQIVADPTQPTAERVAAAAGLGAPAGPNYWTKGNYAASRLLCGILYASAEDPLVRIAGAQALSGRTRAAAPNQLSRYLEGDPDRRVRAAVASLLAHWGAVPETQEPGLRRDLDALQDQMAPLPLANLASTYGGDPRVVALLQQALQHPNPDIRSFAQRGLGYLGYLQEVRRALQDDAPAVRAAAADTLGYYSLKSSDDVAALDGALRDADPQVQRAAKTALRRLGVLPTPTPPVRPAAAGPPAVGQPGVGPGLAAWRALLERWSGAWLGVHEYAVEAPDEVIAAGWLGYPGASEQELQALEQRLGRPLPPSYRTFLQLTNGWRWTSPSMEAVWPTADVDYFRVRNQDWIDAFLGFPHPVTPEEHARYGADQDPARFRAAYLPRTIQVSPVSDAAVYLLNPAVVTPAGEWEAWLLATWLPGAQRYPTFWELMQAEYASFKQWEQSRG